MSEWIAIALLWPVACLAAGVAEHVERPKDGNSPRIMLGLLAGLVTALPCVAVLHWLVEL